jgi:hypothetical protein
MINKYLEMMTTEFNEQNYFDIEKTLIDDFKKYVINHQITNKNGEIGTVTSVDGQTFDKLMMCVNYGDCEKKYDLVISIKSKFIVFNNTDFSTVYDTFNTVHNELTSRYTTMKTEYEKQLREKQQLEEKQRKVEETYQRLKNNNIKSFETQLNKDRDTNTYSEDFYYALGWLTKNVRTVSAALPDYLERPFKQHFGVDTPCRVINSRHRGPAGYQSQWSWSFTITLKDKNVPSILISHLNSKGDTISDTSFIWDLIDTYNFKFGKTQDINSIINNISTEYREFFNQGFSMN